MIEHRSFVRSEIIYKEGKKKRKKITQKNKILDRKLPLLKTIMRHNIEARNNGIMSSDRRDEMIRKQRNC